MAKPARKPLVKRTAIRKRQLAAELSLPKRLLPHITQEELEMVRDSEADHIAAKAETKPAKCSPEFDSVAAFKAFRADDEYLGSLLLSEVGICVPVPYGADIASAFMQGMKPRSLLETLLFSQMIGVHIAAMRELQRLSETSDLERATLYVSRANRLLRMFGLQIEALESLRGKGRQKITVQHRHVSVTANHSVVGVKGGV